MAGISSSTPPVASDTTTLTAQIPQLQAFALQLERKGKAKRTIRNYIKTLKALGRKADLNNTKDIELAIARYIKTNGQPATNNYKIKMCEVYNRYLKFLGIKDWEKPTYTKEDITIIPPNTTRCQMLIASAKGVLSIKIDLSNQTGLRPIEIQSEKSIQVKNIHFDTHQVTARITKGCNPRPPMRITPELEARLKMHILKNNLDAEDQLFKGTVDRYTNSFLKFKKRLAKKLNDPTIKQIRLYDLRHAYATRQLMNTQNTETVRIIMGHKSLDTTQRYLHMLANDEDPEWIVESTQDQKRADELITHNFQYVLTTPDGYMKFRKRK